MNEQEFGAKIKQRREALGISQKELAEALDLDQGKISLIEKGLRRVDVVKELPIIAKVLRCSIGWLFEEVDKPVTQTGTEGFLHYYFPTMQFDELQIKRIDKHLQDVIHSYLEVTDPNFADKHNNG